MEILVLEIINCHNISYQLLKKLQILHKEVLHMIFHVKSNFIWLSVLINN